MPLTYRLPGAWLVLAFAVLLGLSWLTTATAQEAFAPGTVVSLRGTPHLWVADEQGVLHWAGDTRALGERQVNWRARADVSLDQLKALPRGDPWLSAGLLQSGTPIYLVKWETDQAAPVLLHIQSIADVELFGINATNYGALVLEAGQWEARYLMSAATLRRDELAPATAAPAAPAAATPASGTPMATATAIPSPSPTPGPRLNRTPRLGREGDVTFAAPSTWRPDFELAARDIHLELMYTELVIGRWQPAPGVYVQVSAINLDYNADVKTPADLAGRKFPLMCDRRDVEFCYGRDKPTAITIGGIPGVRYDTRYNFTYSLGEGPSLITVEHEWLTRHVFVLRGNWGFEFRLFSEDGYAFSDWSVDFGKVLDAVRFTW